MGSRSAVIAGIAIRSFYALDLGRSFTSTARPLSLLGPIHMAQIPSRLNDIS